MQTNKIYIAFSFLIGTILCAFLTSIVDIKGDLLVNIDNKIHPNITSIDVPDWYLRNRVQVLTYLPAKFIDKPFFFEFPRVLSNAGATVMIREIKSDDESPWWPSKYGSVYSKAKNFNHGRSNLATKIIDQSHNLNMKAIIYYRHTEDEEMLSMHPEWACLDINGNICKSSRGLALSLNSPYREVLIERLKELSRYGADGFYFDYIQIPIGGDFSTFAQNEYYKIYKSDMISDVKEGKIEQYYDFRNATIRNFFTEVRAKLKEEGFNPVLLISGNSWPTLSDMHMNSDFYKDFILKSELEVPNRPFRNRAFTMPNEIKQKIPSFYLNAFTFSFMRDNTLGPPSIWCPQIKDEENAKTISAGIISLGGIAELDIKAMSNKSDVNDFTEVLKWNEKYGEYFEKMRPFAITGVTILESERNIHLNEPYEAWEKVILPSQMLFQKLYKAGIPTRLLSDAQFTNENTEILKTVFANTPNSKIQKSKLKYINKYSNENVTEEDLIQLTETPIYCQKQNEYTHINYFQDNEGYIYIITAPDFQSVKTNFNSAAKVNLNYQLTTNFKNKNTIKLFIKSNINKENYIQNIINNSEIKSTVTEKEFNVYNLPETNSLGFYRFKKN